MTGPLVLLLALSSVEGNAVAQQAVTPLTLNDCVRLALSESPSLRSARIKTEQARRHTYEALAAFEPKVDVSASQVLLGYDNAGKRIESPRYDDDTHVYSLSGSWALYNNGRDWRGLRGSRLDLKSVRLDEEQARRELIDSTVQAYFNELLALRLGGVRKRLRDSRQDYRETTEKLYKAGVRSYSDLLDAKVQVRQQELEVLRSDHGERSARAALNLLLGRPIADALVLADVTGVPAEPDTFEGDLKRALETRSEMKALELAAEKAKLAVHGAWAEVFPALSVDASLSYRFDNPSYSVAPGVSVSATNPYWQVGAKVSLPLFDGGTRWQAVKIAKLQQDLITDEKEAAHRRIASDVLSAHLELEQNRKAWELSKEELATAKEQLAIVLEQYREGNVSALTVKDAQNSLSNLEVSEADALYRAHIARVQLLKAVGTLGPETFQ